MRFRTGVRLPSAPYFLNGDRCAGAGSLFSEEACYVKITCMDKGSENMKIPQDNKENVRLNKYLSDCGVCSRREADRLIEKGLIIVNGKKASLGTRVSERDKVEYKGRLIRPQKKFILLAFNKPKGIECTTDASNPDNIVDFINYETRIFPIGRLDKNSSGLILLTNRGFISDKILRGSNYHEKEYEVKVNRPVTGDFLKHMSRGVPILDTVTRPCTVKKTGPYSFDIILTQGLNKQIRRMCEYLEYEVTDLKRTRIMNIKLGDLKSGRYRYVSGQELDTLLKDLYDGENREDKRADGSLE